MSAIGVHAGAARLGLPAEEASARSHPSRHIRGRPPTRGTASSSATRYPEHGAAPGRRPPPRPMTRMRRTWAGREYGEVAVALPRPRVMVVGARPARRRERA
nr:hypothetical protein [Streptomyces sabulosicollis]